MDQCHRLIGIVRREHIVGQPIEDGDGQFEHRSLVFHHQDRFATAIGGSRPQHGWGRLAGFDTTGQVDLEGGSHPRLAVNVDEAVILAHDAVDGGQPQAGALAHAFGGKERLENLTENAFIHAAAVIDDHQKHIFTGNRIRIIVEKCPLKAHVVGLDGNLAHTGNGIPGVDTQVGQDLIHLGRIDFNGPQLSLGLPPQFDIFADEPAQHAQHPFDGIIEIDHPGCHALAAGESEQLTRDVSRAVGGGNDLGQIDVQWIVLGHLVQGQFRVADDHAQHVVVVVGHAAGQTSHGLHLLGLEQLGLKSLAVGFGLPPVGDVSDKIQ